jgi:undecaprenyl-diphosphatase
MTQTRTGWRKWLARITPRDRSELKLLLGCMAVLLLLVTVTKLASEVIEGETQEFDKRLLVALRDPADPARPIGPQWLVGAALDITALGSATVLGLTVVAVAGFLVLHGQWRSGLFVTIASLGGWFLNSALKQAFQRPRPTIVPHLRDVMTMSFPSGHALISAVVYLTLGTLLMRIAKSHFAKLYCMTLAMLVTVLIGVSRVYLGVHYPTDVLAGWLIGFSWALLCWIVERALERRTGLKGERQPEPRRAK